MKIALACDHGALELKNAVAEHLQKQGHEVKDFGTYTADSCDYPDFVGPAAQAVASGECERHLPLRQRCHAQLFTHPQRLHHHRQLYVGPGGCLL